MLYSITCSKILVINNMHTTQYSINAYLSWHRLGSFTFVKKALFSLGLQDEIQSHAQRVVLHREDHQLTYWNDESSVEMTNHCKDIMHVWSTWQNQLFSIPPTTNLSQKNFHFKFSKAPTCIQCYCLISSLMLQIFVCWPKQDLGPNPKGRSANGCGLSSSLVQRSGSNLRVPAPHDGVQDNTLVCQSQHCMVNQLVYQYNCAMDAYQHTPAGIRYPINSISLVNSLTRPTITGLTL